MAAGVPNANPPPRQRFKTLVGLFPEDLGNGPSAAQASAAELFEDSLPAEGSAVMEAATPASHVAVYDDEDEDDTVSGHVYDDEVEDDVRDEEIRDEADSDEVEVGDEELDGSDDAPTQAYNIAQFAELAREVRGQLESGPRLASRPPPASEDVFSAPAQSPWQARGQAPATPGPSVAAESNLADLFDQEYTMPAAQAVPSSGHTPVALAAVATATVQAPIPVQTPAQPPAPAAKPDRRLLMLTMFFAGTTVALAIVALGLVVRSQSAEQAASALADAPVAPTHVNVPVAPTPAPVAAPAPPPPVVAPPEPPVIAESPATSEAAEPSEKDPAPAPATEAATAEGMDATVRAEPTAAPVAPSPTPHAVRRAAPRKPRTPQRYVPSDI